MHRSCVVPRVEEVANQDATSSSENQCGADARLTSLIAALKNFSRSYQFAAWRSKVCVVQAAESLPEEAASSVVDSMCWSCSVAVIGGAPSALAEEAPAEGAHRRVSVSMAKATLSDYST